MSKISVGDKVVFGRGKKNEALVESHGIVIGKVYEVTECCGVPAIDYSSHLEDFEGIAKITKIVEG